MFKKSYFLIILILIVPNQACCSFDDILWIADFESFESPEWDFQSYNRNFWGFFYPLEPRFSVVDGILRAHSSTSFFDVDMALTESTVAYGSWEFDWYTPDTNENYYYDSVSFIWSDVTGKYNLSGITGNMMNYAGYSIFMVSQELDGLSWSPGIKLFRWNEKSEGPIDYFLGSARFIINNLVSYHFKITRDDSGLFMVEVNNILLLEAQDNNITSSEKFSFASFVGNSGFDNVSVSNFSPNDAFFELDSFITAFIMITAALVLLPFYKRRHAK